MSVQVTTITVTSVTAEGQTWSLSSNVREPVSSALVHLEEMSKGMPVEPHCYGGDAGWRWTWEYVNTLGYRCTETVRIVP